MEMLITSALMATACTLLLGGLLLYRTAGHQDLKNLRHTYLETLYHQSSTYLARLLNLKGELRLAQQQQRGLDYQVFGVSVALLTFVASVLVITVELLLDWSHLMPGAVVLFFGGSICLLCSVGANLRQVWRDHRLVEMDLLELLGLGSPKPGAMATHPGPSSTLFHAPQPPAPRSTSAPKSPSSSLGSAPRSTPAPNSPKSPQPPTTAPHGSQPRHSAHFPPYLSMPTPSLDRPAPIALPPMEPTPAPIPQARRLELGRLFPVVIRCLPYGPQLHALRSPAFFRFGSGPGSHCVNTVGTGFPSTGFPNTRFPSLSALSLLCYLWRSTPGWRHR
ncbi:MAG: hypothetical protein ACO4CG_12550 [Prochlorothrix sp.]